jgi:hypothetical protein
MRDWWYEVIQEKYPTGGQSQLEKLNDMLLRIQDSHASKAELDQLRADVIEATHRHTAVRCAPTCLLTHKVKLGHLLGATQN